MTLPLSSPFTSHTKVTKSQLDQLIASINALYGLVQNPGLTNLTFNSGATNWGPAVGGDIVTPPQWTQIGSLVVLTGAVQRSVTTSPGTDWNGVNVFTALPVGSRPVTPWLHVCACAATNGSEAEMKVGTDGGVQFRNTGSADIPINVNIFISCIFPAG